MKLLVLDNYDSFTYNLVHLIKECGVSEVEIHRNDKIALSEIDQYQKIVLSPGPGIPSEAGILIELIKRYAQKKSILGVCLGHQAITEAFGGKLRKAPSIIHGKASQITIEDRDELLFKGINSPFLVGRYHSWIAENESFPDSLVVTAKDGEGNIMALRHKSLDVRGVQFHPESVLTEHGKQIMLNWIEGE